MSMAAQGQVELAIGGMTCASCAARIEKRLNKLEGVSKPGLGGQHLDVDSMRCDAMLGSGPPSICRVRESPEHGP
jgi:cation transport ATPase